jgi:hypothetical protein
VHRAPGIPHALWGGSSKQNSGDSRREIAESHLNVIARSVCDEAIQLPSSKQERKLDCFAPLAMTVLKRRSNQP